MVPALKSIKHALNPRKTVPHTSANSAMPEDGALESASVEHPVLEALFRFWSTKKTALGHLPSRRDISPSEIKKLLPHIAIADVIDGGEDFCFRVCGTMITEGAGIELTGKSWQSFSGTESIIARSRQLVETAEPYYAVNQRAHWAPKDFQHYTVLALPLASDGKTVDMVLYGLVYHPMDRGE